MFPFYPFIPIIETNTLKPPTLYSILNSIVNFNKENKTKIRNLAKEGHSTIFNFDYPLSNSVNKDNFEILILQHFLMRRIGYQTFTAFQIALESKMNEIMPFFNPLFDSLSEWNLLQDGEKTERINNNNYSSEITNTITNEDSTMQDLRYSNMPQNQLEDVQNGNYMTDYNYNNTQNNGKTNGNTVQDDTSNTNEIITRTPGDKISIIKNYMSETRSIYTMIFKELDVLFYGLD